MKKYLWTVAIVSVLTPNIYAEENPFALQENFQKIDKNTDDLIESLKKIYNERKEKKQVNIIPKVIIEESFVPEQNATEIEANTTESKVTDVNVSKEEEQVSEETSVELNASQEESKANVENDAIFRKAVEEQKALANVAEEERLEKVRQEKEKIDKKQEAEKKKQEMERQALEKEEKRKKVLEEKEQQAKKDAQKALERKENTKKEAKKSSVEIVDINITQDEQDADRAAEDAFLKATKEVEKENSKKELGNKVIVEKGKKEVQPGIDEEKKKVPKEIKQVKKDSENIVDINTTKEELEALEEADEAFFRAIKEVN